jgi:Rieske Fe-S protein
LAFGAAVVGYAVARNSDAASAKGSTAAANSYGNPSADVLTDVARITSDGIVANGVVLTRDGNGAVHAVSATCTHQGCTVSAPSNGAVSCPCHGSAFDAVTGKVLRGPATRPLPQITVHVQGTQVVRG